MKSRIYNRISTLVLTFLALILFGETTITAASGDLDPTFGTGGIVITPITDGAHLYEEPYAIKVQPDGKIVVCGVVNFIGEEDSYTVSTFFARYNPGGTLDASFG